MPPIFRRILMTVFVCCPGITAGAQVAGEYFFTHYTTTSGLLSNQVNTVIQDGEGYIWIGSTDGIQRFDGTRYQSFRHQNNDPLSLPSNPVLQLLLDKKKRLWVMLADGDVGIFNTKNFTFRKAGIRATKKSSVQAISKQLRIDENGKLSYLFYANEVLTWDEDRFEFSAKNNFIPINPSWAVSDIIQQPGTQKYWIGVQGLGITVFNAATGQLSYPGHNVELEPVVDAYDKSIYLNRTLFDKQGRAWFFCWNNVYPSIFCFDTKANLPSRYELLTSIKAYHETHGFFQQRDGSIWVMGLKVFARFLEKEKKFQLVYNGYRNERSIAYDFINSLFEDREGNIWTATDNNGLFRFNPSQEYFTNITHENRLAKRPGNGTPMSFIQTKWGTFFAGTWEDGLFHYDSNFNVVPAHVKGLDDLAGPFVWGMAASADSNTIWMAAQPGIYAVDQAKRVAVFYNPPVLENRTVRQIAEDKNRDLWLGMIHSGLYKWKTKEGKIIANTQPERFTAVPNVGINKIMIDRKGLIWVGTAAAGAYVIDPVTNGILLHFEKDAPGNMQLPEAGVSSLLDYNDSLVVITTATRVLLYNRVSQQISGVGPADAMSGYIAAVERDRSGFVWISTTSGLYRVSLRRGLFVRFNKDDGIQADNFSLASSYQLKDGRLLFGSSNQFIVFDPAKISTKATNLQVTITNIEVMNKELPVDSLLQLKQIVLGYDENALSVSFSSLLYSSPYLIKYKLEGLDKDWKTADKNYTATYSYLPSGEYSLLFKIIDENGNIKNSDLRLSIRINSPFWKSWWFFSLLVLLIGGLIFWIDKVRMKRQAAVQQMRSDIAGNLHKEVNTALSNINILSEMAKLKADDEPQKSKEFIEQIQSKSHNMIIAMDDMLWSIDPANDSMQKATERMQEYIDGLNKQYHADVQLLLDEKVASLKLNMQLRHEVFLLFKECINGLLWAGARSCTIHALLDKNNLLYSMQFKNEHCDMQQLANLLQRQDMQRRLEQLRATINVEVYKTDAAWLLKVPLI